MPAVEVIESAHLCVQLLFSTLTAKPLDAMMSCDVMSVSQAIGLGNVQARRRVNSGAFSLKVLVEKAWMAAYLFKLNTEKPIDCI